jgi:hypothetical protein
MGKCHGCNEKGKKPDDFTGSKKAHDEAEKLRVEYLMAERASEADSEDENRLVHVSAQVTGGYLARILSH